MYKMQKKKNAKFNVKSNRHATLAAVYSSACLRVTSDYVAVNLYWVADCCLRLS